jgi:hypothetical protein
VRRDASYLNWKYTSAPHVRYSIAALRRDERNVGYAVYRHVVEPRGRATLLVDFLTDPTITRASPRCSAGWIARRAAPTPTRSAAMRCTRATAGRCASAATSR